MALGAAAVVLSGCSSAVEVSVPPAGGDAACGAVLGTGVSFKPIGVWFQVIDAGGSAALDGSSITGVISDGSGGPSGYVPTPPPPADGGAGDAGSGSGDAGSGADQAHAGGAQAPGKDRTRKSASQPTGSRARTASQGSFAPMTMSTPSLGPNVKQRPSLRARRRRCSATAAVTGPKR